VVAAARYNQRVDACTDPELKAILAHNRDEEKEHAAMVLEWIRWYAVCVGWRVLLHVSGPTLAAGPVRTKVRNEPP
jgi:hypothetical protein